MTDPAVHIPDPAGRPIAVAIVGCGIIGVNHAAAVLRGDDFALVALIDAIEPAATALADRVEAEGAPRPAVFADLGSALAAGGIDLVAICTPSGLHVSLAEEAVAAGVHVVIEKPLDVGMARARRIAELADLAESRGQVVSVISQHRFDPSSQAVAAAAHSGGLGRLTSAVASVAWWRSQEYYDSGEWRGTWALDGGGAVMNQGVHTVDLLVWFLGRPVEVSARTALLAHDRVEVEDVAVATVAFESGALAVLHATTAAYPGLSVRLAVYGSRGAAVIDDDRLVYLASAVDGPDSPSGVVNQAAADADGGGTAGSEPVPADFVLGHLRQYEDVAAAIREHRAPGVRVRDALLSLAVVRAVYLSARLGRPVAVDDVLSGELDDAIIGSAS